MYYTYVGTLYNTKNEFQQLEQKQKQLAGGSLLETQISKAGGQYS
ncbi:hypothetical protein PsAD46_01374 [Pseudovibrio sp. Ad46]|nr:hypothetical protein PsAD46_01374 [Pseudovibrio sp. Ad46]KZL01966.1 hypothetical protein PsAD5_00218 [Pseudovibrio sp. Ad5]